MNEYVARLKNKFEYSDELSEFLRQVIPTTIQYYGIEYEDIILSAIANCEIHFQSESENPQTFLNSYFDTDKQWEIPDLGGAFYHKDIKVKNNQIVSKSIIYVKRVYFGIYRPFNFNDDKHAQSLIHEICHLIKGYGKLKIENGKIIDSTGLSKDTYSYSQENGVVDEKHEMVGIEEALTDVEAAQILELMTGRKQEAAAYKAAGYSATRLLQHNDLAKIIRLSQFRGDDSWIQYLGHEQSNLLIDNFDILVHSMYISLRDINTAETAEVFYNKMRLAQDTIDFFVNNYRSNKDESINSTISSRK